MTPPTGDPPETPSTSQNARGAGTSPAADAATHDAYWRSSFTKRPYTSPQLGYDHYRPAYRFGWESQARQPEAEFEDVEAELEERWENEPSELSWEEVRPAARDAWIHATEVDDADPGNPLA